MHRTAKWLSLLKQIYTLCLFRYRIRQKKSNETGAKDKNGLLLCPEKDKAEVICFALLSGAFAAV